MKASLFLFIVSLASPALADAIPAYHRDAFIHWDDSDGDCQNTRAEILISLSTAATTMRSTGCSVVHGRWYDPYTDSTFTSARDLDIDHIVPLSFAWDHGAYSWDNETRRAFANDLRNLLPVSASANRSKGDKGPLEWLPPNSEYRCSYVLRFQRITRIYKLDLSTDEIFEMDQLRQQVCGNPNYGVQSSG